MKESRTINQAINQILMKHFHKLSIKHEQILNISNDYQRNFNKSKRKGATLMKIKQKLSKFNGN